MLQVEKRKAGTRKGKRQKTFCIRKTYINSKNFLTKLPPIVCTQGWLKIWIWQLWPKFVTFIPLWILVNGTNIICLPTKNKQFCKIKRLWLKNWACHAHLKFKIQKGVASLFFEPHPPNFGKICILYRWKNDIITFFK